MAYFRVRKVSCAVDLRYVHVLLIDLICSIFLQGNHYLYQREIFFSNELVRLLGAG